MKLYPEAANQFAEAGVARTAQSKRCYTQTVRQLQSQHPKLELHQFTLEHLTQFCHGDGRLAPATVRGRKARLRGFFEWAKFHNLIADDPSTGLKFTVRPAVAGGGVCEHVWLTEHQLSQLVRAQPDDEEGRRAVLVILLGAMMGIRRTEMTQIQWEDLNGDCTSLRVLGKGQKWATLGVPPQLAARLRTARDDRHPAARFVVPNIGMSPQRGVSDVSIYQLVKRSGRHIGINLDPHDLRRTYAGILEAKGMALEDIQKMMRHENISTTQTYLEKNPAKQAGLAAGFTLDL